ncbi:MAG: helix-hairpin-helix domain-containing protein [Gemmatimonadetes bacterium]|nr:helix-hairpin-helix domain-containing protein [Gemmatimonadota bacterium]
MHDAEIRALRLAIVVLVGLSAARWVWSTARSPAEISGADLLPNLLATSDSDLADTKERERPLAEGERLDPNRATAQQLDRLPGIGPSTANAIVRDREENGPFPAPEALTRVRGVGPATLRRMLPNLHVEPHSALPVTPAGPRTAGAVSRRPGSGSVQVEKAPVDVNRADEAALQTLPGVGPALARRIVEARSERPFSSLEELARVRGIGPATVARLKGLATVYR